MKYSVLGFSQEKVLSYTRQVNVEGKLVTQKIDVIDLMILKCVADMLLRDSFIKILVDGKTFTNVHYKTILEDLPIIDINKRTLAMRLDKLVSFGLLEKYLLKEQGSFTYFRTTNAYMELVYQSQKNGGVVNQTTEGCQSNSIGLSFNKHTKDSSTNYSTNTNNKDISNDIYKGDDLPFGEVDSSNSDSNVQNSFIPPAPLNGSEGKPKQPKQKKQSYNAREDMSYVDAKFTKLWLYWLDYKDEIKKPYKTNTGAKSEYGKLVNFSDNNIVLAHAIVMRSIESSWSGLFQFQSEKQKEYYMSSKSPYASTLIDFTDDNVLSTEETPTTDTLGIKWQG